MSMSLSKTEVSIQVPPAVAPPAAEQDSFVINLCSSTTPMALTQPKLAELKNFTFFVSRRLEDGRERFRLHMGYFDSLLQAEELLPVVRDIYPGAWAGEAPGKRLRARAAATNNATAGAAPAPVAATQPVVTPRAAPAPKPVAAAKPAALAKPKTVTPPIAAPAAAPGPTAEMLANMPTLSAAPEPAIAEAEATRVAPAFTLELMDEPPRSAPSELPSAPEPIAAQAAVAKPAPESVKPVPASAPAPATAPAAKAVTRAGSKRDAAMPFDQRSNVREVLKSLDVDLDEAKRQPAPPAEPAPVVVADPKPLPAVVKAPVVPSGPAVREPGVLPEAKVLHLLEQKRGDPMNTTSTPAAFSIQLQWSVQPIDLAKVPPLAIFGAYTLYTVEGSREGRRWFGLRLGFFSDANSAKQVAQYVRSEFSSVAVVPVSLKERDGASGATGGGGGSAATPAKSADSKPTERLPERTGEFKLLDDASEAPKVMAAAKAKPVADEKPALTVRGGQKATKGRGGSRVHASEKRGPKTLEETLEILGADQLQIEGSRKKAAGDGAIRHVDMKVQKNSAFSRLLDRLAERGR
jgi:hypothetical protein